MKVVEQVLSMKFKLLLLSGVLVGLNGCGGSSGDDTSAATNNTSNIAVGQFIDSPVSGLSYVSGAITGVTNANGQFTYEIGAPVQFFIGDILIGQALGASIITPVDLVVGAADETDTTVTNIIRFLQTLDDDANPDNGIEINSSVLELARSQSIPISIDFGLSLEGFANSTVLQSLLAELTAVTNAGARELISVAAAQLHFKQSLLGLIEGTYIGTYAGDDDGQWGFIVDADGRISGIGQSSFGDEVFSISGMLSSSGGIEAAVGSTDDGTTWSGNIVDGQITGTWQNGTTGEQGTFSGAASDEPFEQIDLTNDDDSSNDNDLQGVWRITLDVNSSNCPEDNGSETFDFSIDAVNNGVALLLFLPEDENLVFQRDSANENIYTGSYTFNEDGGESRIDTVLTFSSNTSITVSSTWEWSDGDTFCSGTTTGSGSKL